MAIVSLSVVIHHYADFRSGPQLFCKAQTRCLRSLPLPRKHHRATWRGAFVAAPALVSRRLSFVSSRRVASRLVAASCSLALARVARRFRRLGFGSFLASLSRDCLPLAAGRAPKRAGAAALESARWSVVGAAGPFPPVDALTHRTSATGDHHHLELRLIGFTHGGAFGATRRALLYLQTCAGVRLCSLVSHLSTRRRRGPRSIPAADRGPEGN